MEIFTKNLSCLSYLSKVEEKSFSIIIADRQTEIELIITRRYIEIEYNKRNYDLLGLLPVKLIGDKSEFKLLSWRFLLSFTIWCLPCLPLPALRFWNALVEKEKNVKGNDISISA